MWKDKERQAQAKLVLRNAALALLLLAKFNSVTNISGAAFAVQKLFINNKIIPDLQRAQEIR